MIYRLRMINKMLTVFCLIALLWLQKSAILLIDNEPVSVVRKPGLDKFWL